MAKIQTRKTISVSLKTYQRLEGHREATGQSISGLVERLVTAHLDAWDEVNSAKNTEAPSA